MALKKVLGLTLGLAIVAFTMRACTDIGNKSDGFLPIEEGGTTLLPNLIQDRFIPDSRNENDSRLKNDGSIAWDVIETVLNRAQQQTNEELVAVFSVRDTTGAWYSYYLQPLAFSEEAMEIANGKTQLFLYELENDSLGSVPRIAVAVIPDGEKAYLEMRDWILPITNSGENGDVKSKTTYEECEYEMVAPPASVCWAGGCTYYPAIYDLVCDDSGGDPNYNWPDGSGGGGGSGSPGGSGDPEYCKPPVGCDDDPNAPCDGNPVKNPRIAPQKNSGIQGGRFGDTRSGGSQYHGGTDIKNDFGKNIYAMFSGTVVSAGINPGGLGYYVTIQSQVNGSYYTVTYGHLQDEGRPSEGAYIQAGVSIGKQGDSGNLLEAIVNGYAVSHSHIVIKKRTGSGWHLDNDYTEVINPETLIRTKFDSNGNPISSTDC